MVNVTKKDFRKNNDAFVYIITTYREDLFRTAMAFLKNKEEALEAIQEVTFRAYKKRGQLKDIRYVKTWLIRIMINYCNDVLKKANRQIGDRMLEKEAAVDHTMSIWLEDAIHHLKRTDQELIYLKYFHSMTFPELAEQLKIPESTVKTRVYSALDKLKRQLADEGGEIR
ncbi:sigma-70 family RNA polymerase sigma factor [Gracilibacillus salitolerans]|uniref:Sigma-70 family RNA polymerase sigma factor n=1 Tax=Gracilibacillus salitolerans TaxID=2663022 RepID=A0A5Q2TGT4_9BACI|nr:sigma-70 family RNA polymerase sigma factor [Gracilibacillus salitolerans]QGH33407.1 sigma-70 family RNA polymerase sigma factor [Gracilibacillus salitolerans]